MGTVPTSPVGGANALRNHPRAGPSFCAPIGSGKLRRYHEAGVPHYWLLDPDTGTLNVFRHEAQGYLNVLDDPE